MSVVQFNIEIVENIQKVFKNINKNIKKVNDNFDETKKTLDLLPNQPYASYKPCKQNQ